MKPILEIDAVSKQYLIQKSGQQAYLSLRDSLSNAFRRNNKEAFWALKDVSFDVKPGESIGIIGKNGAGKSTLLKILSQITPPTSGRITARGRIASLLEVGTGFHAELTGRENIFMNGSILGMKREEILRNFDAIVDFSGVAQFIDTPLKHYSSGMQLRLAFAVAAFLENEILIIDEVLAVGDSEFQKRCLGKMQDVARSGRTVLFVSHNIGAVKSLCNTGIVLQKGQLIFNGSIHEAADFYQQNSEEANGLTKIFEPDERYGNQNIRLVKIEALSESGSGLSITQKGQFTIVFDCFLDGINLDCTMEFRTSDETLVFHTGALVSQNEDSKKGRYTVSFELDSYYLNAGLYTVTLIFGKNQQELLFAAEYCYSFSIENDAIIGTKSNHLPGVLRPNFDYRISHTPID